MVSILDKTKYKHILVQEIVYKSSLAIRTNPPAHGTFFLLSLLSIQQIQSPMVVVNTSNPKIVQALLQICDVMGVEAYAVSDETASSRAALLADIERIKNGDTKDFKKFADTHELAEYLGVNWTPADEHPAKP